MEDQQVYSAFTSKECAGCGAAKIPFNAFCAPLLSTVAPALRQSLWKRFGQGFEQAYHACLSWFRVHPKEVAQ